jgi:hypothetical protein
MNKELKAILPTEENANAIFDVLSNHIKANYDWHAIASTSLVPTEHLMVFYSADPVARIMAIVSYYKSGVMFAHCAKFSQWKKSKKVPGELRTIALSAIDNVKKELRAGKDGDFRAVFTGQTSVKNNTPETKIDLTFDESEGTISFGIDPNDPNSEETLKSIVEEFDLGPDRLEGADVVSDFMNNQLISRVEDHCPQLAFKFLSRYAKQPLRHVDDIIHVLSTAMKTLNPNASSILIETRQHSSTGLLSFIAVDYSTATVTSCVYFLNCFQVECLSVEEWADRSDRLVSTEFAQHFIYDTIDKYDAWPTVHQVEADAEVPVNTFHQ